MDRLSIFHRSIFIIIIIISPSSSRLTYHILSDHSDLLEVSIHLVVQLGEPVSHPELEQAAYSLKDM
jgi:hypothetical protein